MGEKLMKLYDAMPLMAQKELYDFALFLLAKNKTESSKKSGFGALKNKISFIAPDFDAPIDDFAEYM